MARISGRSLLGLFRFVKSDAFPGDLPDLLASLSPHSRAALRKPVHKAQWYEYPVFCELLNALEETAPGSVRACGSMALKLDTMSILRILRIFASVDSLVSQGFGSWGSFLWSRHCDTGRVFLVDHGRGTAAMGLEGFPDIAVHHCDLNCAYLEEMGRAVGALDIRVEETHCVRRGDARCEFRGFWGR